MFVVNTGRLACSCSAVSAALAAAEVVPPPAMTTRDRAPATIRAPRPITARAALARGRRGHAAGGPFRAAPPPGRPGGGGAPVGHPPARFPLPVRHLPDPPALGHEQHRRRHALPEDHFHLVALQRGSYLIGDCG